MIKLMIVGVYFRIQHQLVQIYDKCYVELTKVVVSDITATREICIRFWHTILLLNT